MDSASSASSSPPASPPPAASPPPPDPREEPAELNREMERIIEDVENMSVQLTWMAYDMVAVRTNPELVTSLQKLRDAYQRFKATVLGE